MKKTPLNGLKQGAKGFAEKVAKARGFYDGWKERLQDLDGPQAKRDYTPVKIQELRTEARNEALKGIRDIHAWMGEVAGRVLPERKRWTKAALLREVRFADVPKGLSYLENDKNYAAAIEHLNATRELRALIWAGRLDDDSLLEAITDAVEVEDLPLLSVLVSEAGNRKKGGELYKLKVNEALKPISFPETAEAEHAFNEMQFSLDEIGTLENEILNPTSSVAQGRSFFHRWTRDKKEKQEAAEAEAAAAAKKAKAEQATMPIPVPEGVEPELPPAA